MHDITDVRYVKRIILGTTDPSQMQSEAHIEEARALLNRCFTDSPKGHVIATEKSFTILQVGEHQVVLQWVCYHVGFPRKPAWIED